MLQTSNLAVLLIFFLLFLFLVLTKCQVLNLTVGRSCNQVLQRAYLSAHCKSIHAHSLQASVSFVSIFSGGGAPLIECMVRV